MTASVKAMNGYDPDTSKNCYFLLQKIYDRYMRGWPLTEMPNPNRKGRARHYLVASKDGKRLLLREKFRPYEHALQRARELRGIVVPYDTWVRKHGSIRIKTKQRRRKPKTGRK